ncbi:cupin domain-containing protein [Spirosoma pollinicola]|uniref:Cupin n=1 Tax=Spirosoma pollinicola TaxID=2057025 RepID=A0A2K8YS33_9BACT|nr:cupin domain-containing protein [Spirosoma pollinicola]AUD00441.1 cupin [Spirosoma pollinicola]
MRLFLLFWVVVLAPFPAFSQTIKSAVYSINQLSVANQTGYGEQTLLEGATRDFSHLIVQAITIQANQPAQPTQQFDEEAVLIIKTGELTLTVGGKRKILGPGNVVLIMPGDDFEVVNKADRTLTYFQMRYTSNEMPDLDLYRLVGDSFWVDWQEAASTADQPRRNQQTVTCSSVMSNRMAIQVTTVDPASGVSAPHTHRAAEIMLILDHPAQAQIEGVSTEAQVGDLIFVESEVSHRIQPGVRENCTYVSIQF